MPSSKRTKESSSSKIDDSSTIVTHADVTPSQWLNMDEEFYTNYSSCSEGDEWGLLVRNTPILFGEDNSRSAILLEFLYHVLRFCRASSFSLFQAKTAVDIAQRIFHSCIVENPRSSYEDAIYEFKNEIHKICTEENKIVFSIEIIKNFTTFFSKLFFRNFKLYQTVFQVYQEEHLKEITVTVQSPFAPLPLSAGTKVE